jgi:hypothetical protein
MADTDTGLGLGNLFTFFGNDPTGQTNYPALEARRKIALALMARDGKKGYPKNIGEGLASLGDALGEIGMMRALQNSEAGYQKQLANTAPQLVPDEARPPPTSPRADASTSSRTTADSTSEPTSVDVAALPPQTESEPPPTASQPPPPPPAPVVAPPVVPPTARAPVAASPIVRLNRDGTLAGNLTSPNEPPSPVEQPTRAPVTRSVSAQPFLGGNAPYVVGDPTGDQGAKMQALSQYAQTLPQQAPQQVADDPNRIGTPSGGDAMLAALQQRAAELAAARQEGTPEQGSRLAYSFDRLNPQPAVASLSGVRNLDPMTPKDVTQARVLAEVTGMGSDRGYNYPPTASLGREGSVQSDAPQVGITGVSPRVGEAASETTQQMRDAITKQLIERSIPAPEVPQPNPTQAGPTAPATTIQPPTLATGSPPEAANNPPIISDITPQPEAPVPVPGAQTAQAIPPPYPKITPFQDLPQRPTPGVVTTQPPPTPPAPTDVPMTDDEKRGWRMRTDPRFFGDPMIRDQADKLIAQGKQQRDQEYQARLKEYESNLALRNAQTTERETFERGAPERELERKAKEATVAKEQLGAASAADAADLTRRTGLAPEVAMTEFNKLKMTADKDAYAIKELRIAKEALNSGIVSGIGGQWRVNLERLKAWMMDNKAAGDLASNSEMFQAAVKSTVGNALNNLQPGDTRVTNSDMMVASGMIGADPALQQKTQRQLLDIQMSDINKRLNNYEDLKDHYLGGSKLERMFDVPGTPIHPKAEVAKAWTDKLLQLKDNEQARNQFDKEFGAGSAELEIGRATRRARRKAAGIE